MRWIPILAVLISLGAFAQDTAAFDTKLDRTVVAVLKSQNKVVVQTFDYEAQTTWFDRCSISSQELQTLKLKDTPNFLACDRIGSGKIALVQTQIETFNHFFNMALAENLKHADDKFAFYTLASIMSAFGGFASLAVGVKHPPATYGAYFQAAGAVIMIASIGVFAYKLHVHNELDLIGQSLENVLARTVEESKDKPDIYSERLEKYDNEFIIKDADRIYKIILRSLEFATNQVNSDAA